jgi:hypothetical protein
MNTNEIADQTADPAGYGDFPAAATAEPDLPLDLAPRRKGLDFSESLALGIARLFGLEPFFMDGTPQPPAPAASGQSIQFDLDR